MQICARNFRWQGRKSQKSWRISRFSDARYPATGTGASSRRSSGSTAGTRTEWRRRSWRCTPAAYATAQMKQDAADTIGAVIREYSATTNRKGFKRKGRKYGIISAREFRKSKEKGCTYRVLRHVSPATGRCISAAAGSAAPPMPSVPDAPGVHCSRSGLHTVPPPLPRGPAPPAAHRGETGHCGFPEAFGAESDLGEAMRPG